MRASVDMAERRAGLPESSVALIDILLSSLEALAATGQADAACRLAGEACAALRGRTLPDGNGSMSFCIA